MIPIMEKSVSKQPNSAGHPINAYQLVKRWYFINKLAANIVEILEFQKFVQAHGLQMPTEADYIGASAANAKPSGQFDGNTQHAGCPVLVGEKWVANKWIREHGQEFRRLCPLDENAIWDV